MSIVQFKIILYLKKNKNFVLHGKRKTIDIRPDIIQLMEYYNDIKKNTSKMLNKQSWIVSREMKNRVYKIIPNKYLALKHTTAKILKRKRKPHWTGLMAN